VKTQTTNVATEQTVGETIRRLRENLGMSIRTLATESSFSPSFISQLENGQVSPSINSLEKIVNCFGLTLGSFFNAIEPREAAVTRASDRRQLTSGWSKAKIESLGSGGRGIAMEPVLVTLSAGGSSGKHAAPQAHSEFVFLLEGEIELTLGGEEFLLYAGDSATIPPNQARKLRNSGINAARVLIVGARNTR
jgi:quercetin dioxygenase-like cupin family protein